MKTVLLIEDDHWLADSYKRVLTQNGWIVARADNAVTAMNIVEENIPACIVADVMLEGHTVFSLLHELQSYDDTRKIPVIICSGLNSPELTEGRLHQYGVVRVLDKSTLTPEVLAMAVGDVA